MRRELAPQRLYGESYEKYRKRRAKENEVIAYRLKHGVNWVCRHPLPVTRADGVVFQPFRAPYVNPTVPIFSEVELHA